MTLSCAAAGVGASPALAAGAPTPTTQTSSSSGGTAATPLSAAQAGGTPGVPKAVPDAPARVRTNVTRFVVSTASWTAGAAAPTVGLRLDATRATSARVQLRVEDRTTRRIVLRQTFGVVRSGVDVTSALTKRLGALPGSYRLKLIVRDQTGHRSVRTRGLAVGAASATASAPTPVPAPVRPVGGYVFPVQGACNFRTLGAQRFRSAREAGRAHNGQDIGTYSAFPPVVAVTNATVSSASYDQGGGGWTIIFDGDDGTAYGYLHLKAGSVVVAVGQRVTAGQRVANAGNTGGDYEPHLHLEMRPIPWSAHRADAVDPMPLLSKLPNPCDG